MARKVGQTYTMSTRFQDYSYIINGVGGIGKTSLAHEVGKLVTGSNEGTFIITCGGENKPKHIHGAFGDVAPDFKAFVSIVNELCSNKVEYPDTIFVAIDSLDEYARITEEYVVKEWNASCDISERAKSISQAYKGYQKGENRACELMIQQVIKLQNAGYSIIEIGHTKTKVKDDVITKVQYEQLTCNLDNKYYNALKDKVNLVAMCYWENTIENIEEKKNAFTKKMDKVGELVDRKRVMVFADDDNAIDCKTHFEYITHKIDLNAVEFVKAVEDAIQQKLEALKNGEVHSTPKVKKEEVVVDEVIEEADTELDDMIDDDPIDESEMVIDVDSIKIDIRNKHKSGTKEQKAAIKELLNGNSLNDIEDIEVLTKMLEVFE